MNRSRLLATFLVALLVAGAASLFVFQKLRQSTARASSGSRVVVAARDLEIGQKLSEGDLKVVDWPGSSPTGAFSKASDIVGRAVLYPVFDGEVLLQAKLAPEGSGAGLPAVIPAGMRAVSIRVDDVVAVAGFVGPGTRVDVLLTGNPANGRAGGGDESLTKTILENVQVLAAGQKIQPDDQGRPEKVNVVTLLCNPEDAAKVTLAANEGHIQLVLRNPTDTGKVEKEAVVGRQALYGGAPPKAAPAPKPVKRAPRPEPQVAALPPAPPEPPVIMKAVIEVVRGEKVSQVEVGPAASQGGTER